MTEWTKEDHERMHDHGQRLGRLMLEANLAGYQETSRLVGYDLLEFIDAIARGERPWEQTK